MDLDLAHLAAADRIEVTSNLSRALKTVTDAERIRAVLKVLEPLGEGWGVPAEGVPVASLRLNFYQGERLLGNVGLGRKFLTALYRGNFWSRPSETAVYDEVMALLDLGLPRKVSP